MKYTIKDNNGNFICSVEDVDPIRSNEGLGKSLIITSAIVTLVSLAGVGINSLTNYLKKKVDKSPKSQQKKEQKKYEEKIKTIKTNLEKTNIKKDEIMNSPQFKEIELKINKLVKTIYNATNDMINSFLINCKSNEFISSKLHLINKAIKRYSEEDIRNELLLGPISDKILNKQNHLDMSLYCVDVESITDNFNDNEFQKFINDIRNIWLNTSDKIFKKYKSLNIFEEDWMIGGGNWRSLILNFNLTEVLK